MNTNEQISILKAYLEGEIPHIIAQKLGLSQELIIQTIQMANEKDMSLIEVSFEQISHEYIQLVKKLKNKTLGMSHINNYTKIFSDYLKTDAKPDKQYSMLYTSLFHLDPQKGDTILDVGCGSGFFTFPLSHECETVVGIDNDPSQINKAQELQVQYPGNTITFLQEDMRTYNPGYQFTKINAPFVLNYSKTIEELTTLLTRWYTILQPGGSLFSIIDNPKDIVHDNKQYGSIKIFPGKNKTGGSIVELLLYKGDTYLCTLYSCFYEQQTIEKITKEIGFSTIKRLQPLVNQEGIETLGRPYRNIYLQNCDIAYLILTK